MILSIESSCDDSSIAITRIDDYKILFHQKISQDLEHSNYGGVVPEIASRLHAVMLPKILCNLRDKNIDFGDIAGIAVTNEPGLSVSLIEGVMMAKALHLSLKAPLLNINHLKGHIYSLFLEKESIFPLAILLLSGGHTLIIEAYSYNDIRIIAGTLDDSFGEAFDKVAKMLSLSYPGGPIIESRAKNGKDNITFPIPLIHNKDLAFSFSGLKNAVRLFLQDKKLNDNLIDDICFAFQKSAISHIIKKSKIYLESSAKNIKYFGVVGGASANMVLRENLISLCNDYNKEILFAPLEFCSDNAAMIGRCAIEAYKLKQFIDMNDLDISPKSRF
ncbi:tRNA (adenosine(37)-N6)-threonylcarbamoyltransferase complex transferase subunit TsaD [Helicobacter sp. MIT 99-5507]|uniref:tRNA (adenosine(37)-N6)-threonylcarbamoyltransferase complex transferase subunit TsaD n=1 Tax=Helicobacter sp. MIT 99-5507 TaxID=152489 RepID=UPI000E1EEFC2|nr:tRNA (adenosine(37)-N6)-threonylcarbamoyltransferase complex transferase subunit TsaD [Helicobacter sp. MIT 99-5507]RDU58694.1 tRNA (adenosine(37)-N6)-threonylcarbamoyltransferase complex transferase subunit TsaD [Helicobacter sp. MIT 99-5507]